jgi:hypothetical protein
MAALLDHCPFKLGKFATNLEDQLACQRFGAGEPSVFDTERVTG